MKLEYPNHFETTIIAADRGIQKAKSPLPDDMDSVIARFPKTRYYGSKRRLLGWIYYALKDLPFNTVLDGFGGTASVSLLFKAMGKQVNFHDGLLCNTISARALLADEMPFAEITEAYAFIDQIRPNNGFISKTFSGMYYTDEENRWLDGAAKAIHQVDNPIESSVYFYCLFQACLKKRPFNLFHRANLNLRLNQNVTRSFGNWVTWEKTFSDLMKGSFQDIQEAIKPAKQIINILPHGDIARLDPGYDLVYLDPPYVSQSGSNEDYLKRYHFLEGLSDYNEWYRSINQSSSIKAFKQISHISEWQNKREFRGRLFDVINKHNQSIVVLSYLAEAYPSEKEITEHFRKNFRHVHVLKKDFRYALAKDKKIELLFIGSSK
ncbi:MAG: DNA adenine methylase [Methylobacter sp.]|nr:DNA adenine methylase [Methylobacter sp.]